MKFIYLNLFENDDKIGGLINLIWRAPGRNEFRRIIENYTYWIQKHGINLHLDTEVTLDVVKEFNPDIVIVATGSIPLKPPIKGIERNNVYKNNVIIGGGATGVELAMHIAKFGSLSLEVFEFLTLYKALEPEVALKMLHEGRNKVTVLEQLPKLGSALGKTTKWVLLDKCDALGVKFLTSVSVTEIGDNYVSYTDAAGKDQVINDVDMVYYATGVTPNNSLFKEINNLGNIDVHKIGDAKKPQTVLEAIETAYKVANRI